MLDPAGLSTMSPPNLSSSLCNLDLWPPDAEVDRFLPFPVDHLCQFGIEIGSFLFKISCSQVWSQTDGRSDRALPVWAAAWRRIQHRSFTRVSLPNNDGWSKTGPQTPQTNSTVPVTTRIDKLCGFILAKRVNSTGDRLSCNYTEHVTKHLHSWINIDFRLK